MVLIRVGPPDRNPPAISLGEGLQDNNQSMTNKLEQPSAYARSCLQRSPLFEVRCLSHGRCYQSSQACPVLAIRQKLTQAPTHIHFRECGSLAKSLMPIHNPLRSNDLNSPSDFAKHARYLAKWQYTQGNWKPRAQGGWTDPTPPKGARRSLALQFFSRNSTPSAILFGTIDACWMHMGW